MTARRTWGVTLGGALGGAAGTVLWQLLFPHTALAALAVIGPLTTAYALAALVVTRPAPTSVPLGPTTGAVAARTVLPGVGVAEPVIVVPQPRSVAEAAA